MVRYPFFRRRRFLVDRRIQHRFIFLLFLQMVIIFALFGYFTYTHVEKTKKIALNDSKISVETTTQLLDNITSFYTWMGLLSFFVAIALIICGILASHKIAGPVLKLKRFLNEVAQGDFTQQIAFRRKDQLDDFAVVLNETVANLAARKKNRQQIMEELGQRAEALSGALSAEAPDTEEIKRLIGEIRTFFNNLKNVL
ncbi:hypothetical protein ACFLU6_10040 [Acidobacteriota bacterium]